MDNIAFLKECGFIEKDGWLWNPRLNEAVFKIGDPKFGAEDKPLSWVIEVITVTAFNAGSRHSRTSEREQVARELKKLAKKLSN